MITIAYIALGGFLGGACRYLLCKLPHGLLAANTLACFIAAAAHDSQFLAVGLAGALSTWSSLAAHLGQLLTTSRADFLASLLTVTTAGLAATLAGLYV